MACACNTNKKGAAKSFVVTLPGGDKKTYATEIEAKAAVQRAGGGTIRPQ
jgi:hypothetical protein